MTLPNPRNPSIAGIAQHNPPEQGQPPQAPQDLVPSRSEYLPGWRPHNLSGRPVPVCNQPHRKKVFFMFRQNFPYFDVCPLPRGSSLGTTEQTLARLALLFSISYLYTLV